MMTSLKAIVTFIRQAGTDGLQDEETIYRIRLVNTLSLTFGIILFIVAWPILYLLEWRQVVLFPLLIEFVLNGSVIFFNYHKRHLLATIVLYLVQCLVIMYFGYLLGKDIQLQFAILFPIAMIYLIFEEPILRTFAFVCAMVAMVFLEVNYYEHAVAKIPVSTTAIQIIHTVAMISILCIIAVVSRPYVRSNDSNIRLKKANHYKKVYLYQVTHDLRTPLHVVSVAIQLIKREMQKSEQPAKLRELLAQLQAAGDTASNLVNNVLSMEEIEAGKMETAETAEFNLRSFFSDIVSVNRVIAGTRNIQLKLFVDHTMPDMIVSDSLKLNQISTNLLANAIKYAHKNSMVILEVNRHANQWMVRVSNKGAGIPPDIRELLFHPFVTGKDKFAEGTGLGLYIVKNKVESMGGAIQVESDPEATTAFTITLPLQAGATARPTGTADLKGVHVLVADDHTLTVMAVSDMLQSLGCRVTTASNGQEALKKILNDLPDIILLDYNMPVMDGEETLRKLKENPLLCHIPVIVATGDPFRESRHALIAAGADGFMEKPLAKEELQQTLSQFLQPVRRPATNGKLNH